jgi:hypothetical protein
MIGADRFSNKSPSKTNFNMPHTHTHTVPQQTHKPLLLVSATIETVRHTNTRTVVKSSSAGMGRHVRSLGRMLIALLVALVVLLSVAATVSGVPLNKYPVLMSHDAATGEIDADRDHVVDDWTRTQPVGLVAQLDCGARAFDYRPYLKGDILYAHHGPVVVHKPMNESIHEVQQWAAAHPSELVIFYVTACDGGDGCLDKSKALLAENKVHTVTDCADLDTLTFESVMSVNNLLAVVGCVDEMYDSSLNCCSHKWKCYDDSKSSVPWTAFENYVANTTKTSPVSDGRLWMTQSTYTAVQYLIPC